MSPLTYADRGWPVFPCGADKRPRIAGGFRNASRDPEEIEAWWRRWPDALIGVPTGRASGLVILDIDVKDPARYGFDSLDDLGQSILPTTWLAHTRSGGLHVYFAAIATEIRNSAGKLGPGLDVRGEGGYVVVPSPGSGYTWDPHWNPQTCRLLPAPAWLIPPEPPASRIPKPVRPCRGLSPYADSAIQGACVAIRQAPAGRQHDTLVKEAFSIGTLAGAGGIPTDFARRALIDAGCGMTSHDPHHRWTPDAIERVVNECFAAGLARPR